MPAKLTDKHHERNRRDCQKQAIHRFAVTIGCHQRIMDKLSRSLCGDDVKPLKATNELFAHMYLRIVQVSTIKNPGIHGVFSKCSKVPRLCNELIIRADDPKMKCISLLIIDGGSSLLVLQRGGAESSRGSRMIKFVNGVEFHLTTVEQFKINGQHWLPKYMKLI